MTNKEILIKKILYKSTHRGTKEMDILLGNFVKFYINTLNDRELNDLLNLILLEDEVIYKWYSGHLEEGLVPKNKISNLFKKFKI